MKKKIVVILICVLMFSTFASAYSSIDISSDKETSNMDYSHNILSEFFTLTTCEPCKYCHQALINIYANKTKWNRPFYYVTMVYDDKWGNKWAENRSDELNVIGSPTTVWDSDFRRDVTGEGSTEKDMAKFNISLDKCGERNVRDVDLSLDVEWIGAASPDPKDDETKVIVEKNLTWSVNAMDIDVGFKNNGGSQYNGHLHVYVTEVESTYWDDKFDNPYTFAFLDYAWNEDVTLTGGGQWSDSEEWDGAKHQTGYGEFYDELRQENTMVVASILDEDNDYNADETVGVRAGVGTDPKSYDVYFGNTTPPPKVESKILINQYDPEGDLLEFNETYYWQIDEWDAKGNLKTGTIWSFTTRGNDPPEKPKQESPYNNSVDIPIDTCLKWACIDPDFDDVTFDVYFGEDILDLPLVSENQTEREFCPGILKFETKYYWRIVAWDIYGYKNIGYIWDFTTQINEPPYPPKDPYPANGETAVPENVILSWNGTDPNSGDTLTYDVYFDDTFPPYLREEDWPENWWEPPTNLTIHKTYYWYIVSRDSGGLETTGPNWTFTVGINREPTEPIINGQTEGFVEENYDFTFQSTDPDGHDIKYSVDWDDGNKEETPLYSSGYKATLTHAWANPGTYTIVATAIDKFGAESNESYHTIEIKRKSRVFVFNFLEWLAEQFPRALLMLRYIIGYDLP